MAMMIEYKIIKLIPFTHSHQKKSRFRINLPDDGKDLCRGEGTISCSSH